MDAIDDDFGDLYADVEVQATSAVAFSLAQSEDGYNGNDMNKVDAAKSSPVEKSPSNSEKLDSGFDDSDSEDDLNIVLNDDGPVNEESHSRSVAVDAALLSKNGIFDISEPKSSANEAKSENSLQLKYIRNSTSPFLSNMRGKGCLDPGTTSSSGRSDWDADGYNHNKWGRAQFGYGFSLPWHRTIFNINIDAFYEKPWSQSGADITDFFNFGFEEGSWKQYCRVIQEQVRQKTLMQDRAPVCDSLKFNVIPEVRYEKRGDIEKTPADDDTELVSLSGAAKCRENASEVEKGSAILVEDGTGERQPYMDVTYSHFRDSDVVIEISVQDSLLDSSSSHEAEPDCTVGEASGHGDVKAKDNSEAVQADMSSKHLKETAQNVHVPSFHRSLQLKTQTNKMLVENNNCEDTNISDWGGHCGQKDGTCSRKEIAEASNGVSKEEGGVCQDLCGSDPCLIETQSSVSSQNRLCLSSSYSGSEPCDRSEDNVESGYIRIHSPSRKQSLDSETELRDCSSGYTTSTSDGSKAKMVAGKTRSVQPSPVRERQKYGDTRIYRSPERISYESNYDASPVMQARADKKTNAKGRSPVKETRRYDNGRKSTHSKEIYPKKRKDVHTFLDVKAVDDKDRRSVGSRRHENKLPDIGYYSRDSSRYRERRNSHSYHEARFAFRNHKTVSSKYSWAEADWSSRENLNRGIRKNNDVHHFCRRGVSTDGKCDGESKWHHGHARLSEDSSCCSDKEWRKLTFKLPSVRRQRASLVEREDDRFQSSKRTDDVGCLHENYPLQDRDHISVSLAEYERDFQVRRYGGWPEIGRETGVSKWMDWNGDTALCLDGSWHMEKDNDKLSLRANRGMWHCNTSPGSEKYDLEFTKAFHIHEKRKFSKNKKNYSMFGHCNDDYDVKDGNFYDYNQVDSHWRRCCEHSKIQRLEDNFTLRRQDDRYAAEEDSVLHERSSKLEIANVKNGYGCGSLNIFQIEAQRCRNFTEGHLRSYNISSRSQQRQMFLNCRDANEFVGKGKCRRSHYYDRILSDHWNEKMDKKFLKESSYNGLSDRRGAKRTKNSFISMKDNRNDEKELLQQDDEPDVEEGQIMVEEKTMGKSKHVAETASVPCNVHTTLQHGSSFSKKKAAEQYDNDWILKSLAKMEKRRERFKDPIVVTRQTDDTLEPVVQVVVDGDITKVKEDRPARKRRWGVT